MAGCRVGLYDEVFKGPYIRCTMYVSNHDIEDQHYLYVESDLKLLLPSNMKFFFVGPDEPIPLIHRCHYNPVLVGRNGVLFVIFELWPCEAPVSQPTHPYPSHR